jgi:hypothetical protein
MKYHYRVREIRWDPDKPFFIIDRTKDSSLAVGLGLANWVMYSDGPFSTLEAALATAKRYMDEERARAIKDEETKTRYHYL